MISDTRAKSLLPSGKQDFHDDPRDPEENFDSAVELLIDGAREVDEKR
jgi:hypothetical protein